jgi:hypothetical protein
MYILLDFLITNPLYVSIIASGLKVFCFYKDKDLSDKSLFVRIFIKN